MIKKLSYFKVQRVFSRTISTLTFEHNYFQTDFRVHTKVFLLQASLPSITDMFKYTKHFFRSCGQNE